MAKARTWGSCWNFSIWNMNVDCRGFIVPIGLCDRNDMLVVCVCPLTALIDTQFISEEGGLGFPRVWGDIPCDRAQDRSWKSAVRRLAWRICLSVIEKGWSTRCDVKGMQDVIQMCLCLWIMLNVCIVTSEWMVVMIKPRTQIAAFFAMVQLLFAIFAGTCGRWFSPIGVVPNLVWTLRRRERKKWRQNKKNNKKQTK